MGFGVSRLSPRYKYVNLRAGTHLEIDDLPGSVFGFQLSGSGLQVSGFGVRVSGFRFQVLGSGFRVSAAHGMTDHS